MRSSGDTTASFLKKSYYPVLEELLMTFVQYSLRGPSNATQRNEAA